MLSREELKQLITQKMKVRFSRSGGAGGQNVNKVNTKVAASLHPRDLDFLTEEQKSRLNEALKNRLSRAGQILIQVQDERTQARNLGLAVERLTDLVTSALRVRRKRKKTSVPAGAKVKRLEKKRKVTEKKRQRRFSAEAD